MAKINLRNKLRDKNNNDGDNSVNSNIELSISNDLKTTSTVDNQNKFDNTNIVSNLEKNNNNYNSNEKQELEEEINKTKSKNIKLEKMNKIGENKVIYPVEEDDIFKKQSKKSIFESDNENKKESILDRLNINKKMFFVAVGMALVASILVINYLNSLSAEKLYNSELVTVLVAKKEIPEKKVLTKDDLAKLEIPKKFVLKDAVILNNPDAYKDYLGKIALTTIYPNEQIISKRFVSEKDSPWISPIVPINHRAININSKSLSYIKPSDHVDIIISIPNPKNKNQKINTPILQNALVLAVDGKLKVSPDDPFTSGNTITVAIPNNLVYIFSLLQDKAEFQLVLRRDEDNTVLESKYSLKDIEKIFNDSNTDTKQGKTTIEKPIIIERKPIVIQQPIKQPVYQEPVYRPVQKNQPIKKVVEKNQQKPQIPKKEVKIQNQEIKELKATTVTVINGTNIKQQNVPKEER
jgi:pilus assembly protein CpaB